MPTSTVYHYAVTLKCWRGMSSLYALHHSHFGRLHRACDWKRSDRRELRPSSMVTCDDCIAYITALKRMGYLKSAVIPDPQKAIRDNAIMKKRHEKRPLAKLPLSLF